VRRPVPCKEHPPRGLYRALGWTRHTRNSRWGHDYCPHGVCRECGRLRQEVEEAGKEEVDHQTRKEEEEWKRSL
jgi:hypothetical protein